MRAVIATNPSADHQKHWSHLLEQGLRRHGIETERDKHLNTPADPRVCRGDFVVCWGWRQGKMWLGKAPTILVVERGYVGRRTEWTSLGWNGLNGRADFCNADVPGDRAERWRPLLKPCRDFGDGPVVIMGQVAGDQAWNNQRPDVWYKQAREAAGKLGREVYFRPHPLSGTTPSEPLADALARAAGVLTFNSNSGVDAVLAGVPTVAADAGSMVFGLAPNGLPFQRIDETARDRWLERLAYCQWNAQEFADGTAWDHIKRGLGNG